MRDLGSYLAELTAAQIARTGQMLTVTPSQARLNAGERPFAAMAIIEPPDARDVARLQASGVTNVANADAHVFSFAGDSGVRETDTVVYNGFVYELFSAPPDPMNGVNLNIRCVGMRQFKMPSR